MAQYLQVVVFHGYIIHQTFLELAGVKPASERIDIRRPTSLALNLVFRPADKAKDGAIRKTILSCFVSPFAPKERTKKYPVL